eukprot:Seg1047.1 transcript_id=Seg1047.1/GoldUCD/mRNA.D3Y31 product="hypothetical protein" protein_id=Seg1047.1/GoldUCD/D3Y31
MLLISILMIFISIKSSHQMSSVSRKSWRNFPMEQECAMYHRKCSLNSDCGKCYNKPMKCRFGNSVTAAGLDWGICKIRHEDDPYKKRGEHTRKMNVTAHIDVLFKRRVDET